MEYLQYLLGQLQTIQPFEQFLIFMLMALQIMDIVITTKILKKGGRKLNWIMATLMSISPNGWGILKYYLSLAAALLFALTGNGNFILLFCFVMIGVVWWNMKQLDKMK